MAADVMGRPTTSRYDIAFGDDRKKGGASDKSHDVLDRLFSGWENVFCAPRSMETYAKEVPEEPDVLDYVFEHVESFTCADETASYQDDPFFTQPRHAEFENQPHFREFSDAKGSFDIKRENSLVEEGPNGAPELLTTTRPQRRIASLGEEGDLLDYCFEHVESYVCNTEPGDYELQEDLDRSNRSKGSFTKGGRPLRNTTNQRSRSEEHPIPREISTTRKKKKRRGRRKQKYYPEVEDNILLYYRPTTTRYGDV